MSFRRYLRKSFRKQKEIPSSESSGYSGIWRSVYFHHIGKTAGTSYKKWLRGSFHSSQIFREFGISRKILELDLSRYRFFSGHFPITFSFLLPRPCARITVLRDPKSVVLSGYNHLKREEGQHANLAHRKGRPLSSFDDFLNDDVLRCRATNRQVFSLGWKISLSELVHMARLIPDVDWSSGIETESVRSNNYLLYGPLDLDRKESSLLDAADDMLFREFVAFGIVEKEEDSLSYLSSVLNCETAPKALPRLNRSADREGNPLRLEDLSREQKFALEEMTALDQQIYDRAAKKLAERSGAVLRASATQGSGSGQ